MTELKIELKDAIEEITGKEPSPEELKKIVKIARNFGWRRDDPIFNVIALLDAEYRLISEILGQAPEEIKAGIARLRELSEAEIALHKAKIELLDAERESKFVDEIAPNVADRIADRVETSIEKKIERLSVKVGIDRAVLMICLAVLGLTVVLVVALFIAWAVPLLGFLKHVNASIYSVEEIIKISIDRIASIVLLVAMVFSCLVLSFCLCLGASSEKEALWAMLLPSFVAIGCCVLVFSLSSLNSPNINIVAVEEKTTTLDRVLLESGDAKPDEKKDIKKK